MFKARRLRSADCVRFDSMVASCAEFCIGVSGLAGLFAHMCFVLFCCALLGRSCWRKARFLFSGRVFSHKVDCLLFLTYFEFRCSMCGILSGHIVV